MIDRELTKNVHFTITHILSGAESSIVSGLGGTHVKTFNIFNMYNMYVYSGINV